MRGTRAAARRRGVRALARGVGAAALAAATLAGAAEDDARALVKRVLDAAPTTPFTARAVLTIEGGPVRELAMSHKRLGDARASYLEVTAPLNVKDMRFLFLERAEARDEQYMYLPLMRRVTQVSEDARRQPFLGSEYWVSDLVTPALDDYGYAFVGAETVQGRSCWLVEATPRRPEDALYAKTVFAVDPERAVVMRADFFDGKGKPLKRWTIERLEPIDGVWTPTVHTMTNVQESARSRLELTEIRYGVEIPDEVFGRAHLAR